jgi:bifunctional enzyme CysN/CysC
MITDTVDESELLPVTAEERAARFAQNPSIILLTGTKAQETAYILERKLFDNGHAATVLETMLTKPKEFAEAIKNAGLLCLCVGLNYEMADLSFDTNALSADEIHDEMKIKGIIH